MSRQTIQRAILRTLSRIGTFALPQDTLFDEVKLSVPGITGGDFTPALEDLESLGAVASGRSALDVKPRWRITATGQALLAEGA